MIQNLALNSKKNYRFKKAECGHPSNRSRVECFVCNQKRQRIKKMYEFQIEKKIPDFIVEEGESYADVHRVFVKQTRERLIDAYCAGVLLGISKAHLLTEDVQKANNLINKKNDSITIYKIQKAVCDFFELPFESTMKSSKRTRDYVQARHISMYLCSKTEKWTYKKIGLEHGGRDHSTVIHAVDNIEGFLEVKSYTHISTPVEIIKKELYDNSRTGIPSSI